MLCFRRADYGTPLRTIPASSPGRYHHAGEHEATQYLCLHPLGPLAELMRNNDLRTPEQVRSVRTRTWVVEVPTEGLVDIGFDDAARFGVAAEDLVADDQTMCRQLAARLRRQQRGIVVPSAALPGTRNVVLFGPRVASPWSVRPLGSFDLGAGITAQDARPLLSLLARVRFHGQPDPALLAWRQGLGFEFVEPDWSLPEPS